MFWSSFEKQPKPKGLNLKTNKRKQFDRFGAWRAILGAVAQAVLQKPLKQAARTVYRVTGPWKEPVIEVVEKGPPPTRAPDAGPGGRR